MLFRQCAMVAANQMVAPWGSWIVHALDMTLHNKHLHHESMMDTRMSYVPVRLSCEYLAVQC